MDAVNQTERQMANADEIQVTEFELQLWRVFYGFLRWQEECEKNANGTLLSGNELAILHIISMKNRPKTLTDIERLLNRNDTHNIRYSIKKLLKMDLIKKTLSTFSGKNYFFEITEKGLEDTQNYFKMRKFVLIPMFQELSLDLEEMTKNLTKIKAIYDEADRAVAQNMMKSEYPISPYAPEKINSAPRGRILLVEDHPTTAKVTKKILSDLNYQVDIASSGDLAITSIEENYYDIIFMDISLPDSDGYEITRKIRFNKETTNTHTPIIGLTAQISSDNKRDCIEAGMNAVFTKPLKKEKVEDIFAMFVPKHNDAKIMLTESKKSTDESLLLNLPTMVINLDLGASLVGGNKDLAKEAIEMLVESFSEELPKLEDACQSLDFLTAQAIMHKLRGGISYCGVPRLNEVCIRLDDYLKSGKTDLILELYNLLLLEFDAVRESLSEN